MNLSLRASLATLAATAGLVLATAGPAAAQQITVRDARGDVLVAEMSENADDAGKPAPKVANGDVLRTVLRHNQQRIVVRVKYADLQRRGAAAGHYVRVVTNEKMRRDVFVTAGPGMWRGEAEMARPNGDTVPCQVRHAINYDTNVVFLSFPRSCVSNPRWVQLGFGAFWITHDLHKTYADDALVSHAVNDQVRLSPRLRRG